MYKFLVSIFFIIVILVGCDSSTETLYEYRPSFFVFPEGAESDSLHQLKLQLAFQTPDKNCWMFDRILFGQDSDKTARVKFVMVNASIKRVVNTTTCSVGLDTLRSSVTIPFDSAGNYYVDFPQFDSRGNYFQRRVLYTVK